MVRKVAFVAITISLSAAMISCAGPGASVRADIQTMRNETSSDKLTERGDAFASVGDMTRAEQYYAAALKSGGNSSSLTRKLLTVCIADGRYPAALEIADSYLIKHPKDTDVRYAAATIHAAIGDEEQARLNFEQVLRERPNDADAHYGLASILRQKVQTLIAADWHFREYLKLKPNGPYAEAAQTSLLKSVP